MFISFSQPCEVIVALVDVSDGAFINMAVEMWFNIGALSDVAIVTLAGVVINTAAIVLEFVVASL